jgi:hypothetical protein
VADALVERHLHPELGLARMERLWSQLAPRKQVGLVPPDTILRWYRELIRPPAGGLRLPVGCGGSRQRHAALFKIAL